MTGYKNKNIISAKIKISLGCIRCFEEYLYFALGQSD